MFFVARNHNAKKNHVSLQDQHSNSLAVLGSLALEQILPHTSTVHTSTAIVW